MWTERKKMLAGELYDPMDPELVAERTRARDLCQALNAPAERASWLGKDRSRVAPGGRGRKIAGSRGLTRPACAIVGARDGRAPAGPCRVAPR
jgi:Maltose acetyltransferase.